MRALIIVAAAVMVLSIGSPVVANEMNLTTPSNAAAAAASAVAPAATTTSVNSPAAGGSPHPGTLDGYETVPGGAATEDPAFAYDTTSDEITQNTLETLVAYNGTSTATFVPVLATCVPGQGSQCNHDYGGNFTGIYNATGAAFTGANGNPEYWTFVIDPAAHFYDPTTKKSWKVFPTDVFESVARAISYANYADAPGWIQAQALLPIGNSGWDDATHFPYNNTPQNVYDSMLINSTQYCPASAMNGVMGDGCITFVADGEGSYWSNFLQFVEDVSGASITSSGFYQANAAALPGWDASHAAHGDGPTKLPNGDTSTSQSSWATYVNGLSLYAWDSYESASYGQGYPYVPAPNVQWNVVGSGPYYAKINPHVSYALALNPAYEQPSGCGGNPGSFAQIGGTPYCDPAPGHFIENVSIVWETTAEGDTLGTNAISAGTADFAGFETQDLGLMEEDTNSSLWTWFLAPSLSSFFVPINLLVDEGAYNSSGLGATNPYGNGGQSLPENAFSDLGMRNFLTESFPYTEWEDTINEAAGIETAFLAGGPIPVGMGNFYPDNVTWPYEGGGANGNINAVGSAGWWWNQIYNDTNGAYYDSQIATTCNSGNPCAFPIPYFDGDTAMEADVQSWASAIDAISGGALDMFTYGLAFAGVVPSIIYEFSTSALVGAIGTGWSPDYPSPSDYMAPEVEAGGDYSGPNSVGTQLALPQYNLASCPDNISNAGGSLLVEEQDLGYWANAAQDPAGGLLNSGCQGVAYNVTEVWQGIAASDGSTNAGVLAYNQIEQILNGLSLLIYNSQDNALFSQAPWISEASVNQNPVVGAGGIPVYYEIKYTAVTPTAKVDVTEKGLPVGTTWHFSLNANGSNPALYRTVVQNTTALGSSSTGTIAYSLPTTTNVTLNAKQFYYNVTGNRSGPYNTFDNATLDGYSVVSVTGSGVNYPYANVTAGSTLKITVLFGANTTVTFNAGSTKTGYSGLPTNTWSVTLTPTTKGTPVQPATVPDTTGGHGGINGNISFNLPAGLAYKYVVTSPTFYKSTPTSGGGSVRTASTTDIYFALVTGNVVFVESGLAPTTPWSVTLTCVTTCGSAGGTFSSSTSSQRVPLASGTYTVAFSSETDYTLYATTEINVSAPHGQSVIGHYDQGKVTFSEAGLAHGTSWGVDIASGPEAGWHNTTSPSEVVALSDGTYTVSFAAESDYSLYATTEVNVSLTHGQSVRVAYDQARVNFAEIGLAHGASWGVDIASGPEAGWHNTTSSSEAVYLSDGTFAVSFASESDFSLYATTEINVTLKVGETVDAHYDQGRVTFTKVGLHAGNSWDVNVTCTTPTSCGATTFDLTGTSSLVAYLEDGTYSVTYYAAGASTTNSPLPSITVTGTGAQTVPVHWT